MNLILIGLRGTGKSTAGRATADLLARPFIDLDDCTSEVVGCDASTCFREHGEAAWRAGEVIALKDALDRNVHSIIALGGGTPMAPGAETCLGTEREERRVRIGWLDATPEVLTRRIGDDPHRPALTDLPALDEMKAIDLIRRPIFQRIADERIDVTDLDVAAVVGSLMAMATRG
jgi:shikimate kinase